MSLHDLKTLILSHHPLVLMDTLEEDRAADLLEAACDELGMPMFEWSMTRGLCRRNETLPLSRQSESAVGALKHVEELKLEAVFLFKDLRSQLDDPALQRVVRDICNRFRFSKSCLVMLGDAIELTPELDHDAVSLEVQFPNARELTDLLYHTIKCVRLQHNFEVTLSDEEQHQLVRALQGMTLNQARQSIMRVILDDGRLDVQDVANVHSMKAAALREGGLLEFYPPEDNAFELGGFDQLKTWLNRAAMGFRPEAQALNLSAPKGVLLTGVQGCGKSLAAKAIARQWQIPLLKFDAGRLYDKYIGESEKNFRRAMAMAESMAPCVLWIDEIEKAFAAGSDESTDGGTSQRILATFLTWMQEKEESVFLVATANNIDRLPPEMMRKGRFDEIFFVDLPTPAERATIWEIQMRMRNQNVEAFDLGFLVEATEGFSGAEIEQAVIGSLYRALELRQTLTLDLLTKEIYGTVPLSISRAEDVSRLRRFGDGPVCAGDDTGNGRFGAGCLGSWFSSFAQKSGAPAFRIWNFGSFADLGAMVDPVLEELQRDSRASTRELAELFKSDESEIKDQISNWEDDGTILGYQAVIDPDRAGATHVTAFIEVKLTPEREGGFDRIAKRISKFEQVRSCFLMSGGYDLVVVVQAETLRDVAQFVAEKLSTLDGVLSTATHFQLKVYKQSGFTTYQESEPERLAVSP